MLHMGIDIGSKTVKIVVQDDDGKLLYDSYDRHLSNVRDTLVYVLERVQLFFPEERMTLGITGSAGMQLASICELPFIQEVVACRLALEKLLPEADVAIEIGGEDSKILFLTGGDELRMNSTCAGGTGGFIDTLAGMMDVKADKLNYYAHGCKQLYPIASRCAVFAQADVRPLLNQGVPKEDIAGSVFEAVAEQVISGLACGRPITGKVALLGGPLHFLSSLRESFKRKLQLSDDCVLVPSEGHLFVAQGAAFAADQNNTVTVPQLRSYLNAATWDEGATLRRMEPLFESREEYQDFLQAHASCTAKRTPLSNYEGDAYLGVDSGSEAIKYVLIGDDGSILRTYYQRSVGNLLEVAKEMFEDLYKHIPLGNAGEPLVRIAHATVTGYGEAYLREAFALDSGEVETVAHIKAAQHLVPDVSFILDIGGQDIKCAYIRNGNLDNVVLNEACSSGCGALLSGTAWSMNVHLEKFIQSALFAERPVDLGTRCTVFMNSRVRHAQKEGVELGDIAAGLAYSVVRNALYKVMRIHDVAQLGEKIVVQGGTFSNDAVLRAFEKLCGKQVYRPQVSAYMGAFGAALISRERAVQEGSSILSREEIKALTVRQSNKTCTKCGNACLLTESVFGTGEHPRTFIAGNRCEKGGSGSAELEPGLDLFEYRNAKMFHRPVLKGEQAPRGSIGLLRCLGMYETYPFWHAFFSALGFRVELSRCPNGSVQNSALATIPSESVCYPAKLMHCHVMDLVGRGVDRVFLPYVGSVRASSPSCPVSAGYPLVLESCIHDLPEGRLVMPQIEVLFSDEGVDPSASIAMRASLAAAGVQVEETELAAALESGVREMGEFRAAMLDEGQRVLDEARRKGLRAVVVAGRPYHSDPQVHHGIPGLLRSYGYAVLTADSIPVERQPTAWWDYPSAVLAAAEHVAGSNDLDLIELYSFGCGLDAATCDMVQERMEKSSRPFAALKIDQMADLAAIKIRIRSLIAAREGLLGATEDGSCK